MRNSTIKKWFRVHRWTSLICTIFILILCLTGLPLIFGEEINHYLDPDPPQEVLPANTPMTNVDNLIKGSLAKNPGLIPTYVYFDDDESQITVNMATSWKQFYTPHSDSTRWMKYDSRTGKLLRESEALGKKKIEFISLMLDIHRGLFMGLGGELFLGLMGLLFVVAIISGFALYGPFMKKLPFGIVRAKRSARLKWLDLHNLLGITTGIWLLVVGFTGFFNELSTPLFGIFQMTDVQKMLAPYKGLPPVASTELSSQQNACDTVATVLPNMQITSLVFPGSPYGSSQHYLIWAKGNTPLTSRLFNPTLVDARNGKLTAVVKMPWYLRSLEVTRPLHFGDYGGTPLKILWTLFDIAAIIVLYSGVYLWFKRKKTYESYFNNTEEQQTDETPDAATV